MTFHFKIQAAVLAKPTDSSLKMPQWCFSLSELSIFWTVSEDVGLCEVNFPFLNPALYLWLTKKISTSIKGVCWAIGLGENHHDKSLVPLQNSPIYDCLFLSLIVFVFHGYDGRGVKYIHFLLISTHSKELRVWCLYYARDEYLHILVLIRLEQLHGLTFHC